MNWDEYFMKMAETAALKSQDPSTQVGCVIVSEDNKPISFGCNNFIEEADPNYMTIEKPMRYLLSVHAEMRAILHAGRPLKNCKAYVTHASCENCLKHMIVAGVKEIIYKNLHTNSKFIDEERIDAITRLMKGTNIINRNINGKSFLDEIKEQN